jgi:hypothetical protein
MVAGKSCVYKGGGVMKKLLYAIAGALTYLTFSLVLTGYDHKFSHKMINVTIVNEFAQRFGTSINENDKFYNYLFLFSGGSTMEGDEISQGGMLSATSSTAKKDVVGWVEHGGMSADEPQLPASFTHFYDPTEKPGERYLKNLLNDFFVAWAIDNPKVDHVDWAIKDSRNEYNYEAGKQYFKNALEQADPAFRKQNMAFAYRALGQTLHLIADMGIASHVRDDAHPGVGTGAVGYKYSYDADPYEEVVYHHAQKGGLSSFMQGKVDPAVKSFSQDAKTVKVIAEKLAAYTNSNFFSHETISGKDVVPKIHPEKTYPSPRLESCSYDQGPAIYNKKIGENNVKMCKDLSYLSFLNDFRGDPYLDEECIVSQATALMPQIREAGVHAIRCFIPKLEVKIISLTGNVVEGAVIHSKDEEYPVAIKYNGLVQIKSEKTQDILYEINCEKGLFKKEIDLSKFNPTTDKLIAEIECGNIWIKSKPFAGSPAPKWKYARFSFDKLNGKFLHVTSSGSSQSEFLYKWTWDDFDRPGQYANGVFTSAWDTVVGSSQYRNKGSLSLRIDETSQKIVSGTFTSEIRSFHNSDTNYYVVEFEVSDVKSVSYGISSASFSLKGSDVCKPAYFSKLFYETAWGVGTGNIKNTLQSYTCTDQSIFAVILKEKKW